jgi:hypothetical protein
MTRYFFHATDGYSVVLDRAGRHLFGRDLDAVCADVAAEVRARFGSLADLSDWVIAVHDDLGEGVATISFADLAAVADEHRAAA